MQTANAKLEKRITALERKLRKVHAQLERQTLFDRTRQ